MIIFNRCYNKKGERMRKGPCIPSHNYQGPFIHLRDKSCLKVHTETNLIQSVILMFSYYKWMIKNQL